MNGKEIWHQQQQHQWGKTMMQQKQKHKVSPQYTCWLPVQLGQGMLTWMM